MLNKRAKALPKLHEQYQTIAGRFARLYEALTLNEADGLGVSAKNGLGNLERIVRAHGADHQLRFSSRRRRCSTRKRQHDHIPRAIPTRTVIRAHDATTYAVTARKTLNHNGIQTSIFKSRATAGLGWRPDLIADLGGDENISTQQRTVIELA